MEEARLKIKTSARLDIYRNDAVGAWVNESFRTDLEKSAAWAMFAHLCNEYDGVRDIVKGGIVETIEEG